MSFLALTAPARARALCADFAPQVFASAPIPHDSLHLGTGALNNQKIYLLAQDARVEGGSFGAAESDATAAWFQHIAQSPAPVFLALDSGGARMSEGLDALGGFRRLFAAAADAWLAGAPLFFICGRSVFGGASMLACLGERRAFFERSLFGMSGPRIVEAVAGKADFDADDKALLREVMGGAARVARDGNDLIADDATAIVRWMTAQLAAQSPKTTAQNPLSRLQKLLIRQRQQLEAEQLTRPPTPLKIPAAQFPIFAIRNAWIDDGVLLGRTIDDGYLYGLVNEIWADSWHAWKLCNALITQAEFAPQVSAIILLDCPAHATSRSLEAGMISAYFSLLGLVVRYLHTCGANVQLTITGEAAGGVHVALAGGASRVLARSAANIRILPKIAIAQVKGEMAEAAVSADDWLRSGVVDHVEN